MKTINNDNFDLAARIDYGVKAGVRDALIEHKRLGKPIYVLKNDKIVKIPPDQIIIRDLPPYPPT